MSHRGTLLVTGLVFGLLFGTTTLGLAGEVLAAPPSISSLGRFGSADAGITYSSTWSFFSAQGQRACVPHPTFILRGSHA